MGPYALLNGVGPAQRVVPGTRTWRSVRRLTERHISYDDRLTTGRGAYRPSRPQEEP